jgi:hypothetical protein
MLLLDSSSSGVKSTRSVDAITFAQVVTRIELASTILLATSAVLLATSGEPSGALDWFVKPGVKYHCDSNVPDDKVAHKPPLLASAPLNSSSASRGKIIRNFSHS